MFKNAFEHVGDDLHVTVGVGRKPFTGGNAIVVQNAKRSEMHMVRVVIIGKRESEIGIQPAVVEMAAVLAFADVDQSEPPEVTAG
jgi:hypothetical protein